MLTILCDGDESHCYNLYMLTCNNHVTYTCYYYLNELIKMIAIII